MRHIRKQICVKLGLARVQTRLDFTVITARCNIPTWTRYFFHKSKGYYSDREYILRIIHAIFCVYTGVGVASENVYSANCFTDLNCSRLNKQDSFQVVRTIGFLALFLNIDYSQQTSIKIQVYTGAIKSSWVHMKNNTAFTAWPRIFLKNQSNTMCPSINSGVLISE